jgi:small-conductance mechanosensitive channel
MPSIVTGLLIILFFYLIARLIRYVIHRSIKRVRPSEHAARVVSRLASLAVLAFGIVVGLGVMGINAAALVASLGLVSVGIGFALKDVIENFIAGIILILQRPFVVGDVVQIGDVEGAVEDVRVRDTVIRMLDGRQVFVPNAGIFTKPVINNNRNRLRRLDFELKLAYKDDAPKAIQEASRALAVVSGVLPEPSPLVVATSLEDGSTRLKAYFWLDPLATDLLKAKSQAILAIRQRFAEARIAIPSDSQS